MSRTKIDIILKKFLAVVLSMAVVFTAIPVNFAYGEEAAAPGITVDSAEAYPGDSVTVSVRATDLNTIGGLEYALKYDADVMTVKSTSKGSLVNGAISDINSSEAGIVKASVASVDGISGSGVLMSVTFDITKDAAAGSYKLEPTVSDVYDTSFNSVTVSKSPGTLAVKKKDETPQAASFHTEISKSQIDEGETFTYQVNSSDIGKLAGGDFIIVYDAEYLKAESVSAGKALQAENAVCSVNDKTAGRIKISCAGIDAIDAPYGTTLAEVTFRGKAPSKGKTEIKFTAEGLTDVDLKAMTASACTDSITVNQKQEEVVKPQMQIRWDGKITDKRNITVDVSLPEDCPVSAGDFVIRYNKEQIVCTSAETDGELSGKGGIIVTKEETGNGAVRFSYVNPDPSNEAVVLLHLTFAVQGKFTGVTELTPSGKDVVDKVYNDIELDYAPVELDIPKIDISGSTVTGIEKEYVYAGKAITPEVIIEGLTKGQDYEVAYSDNVNVGTATVTINGKGSCTGKIEKTFSITPADISKKEVAGLKDSYVYTGKAITPELNIEGLTEKQDYEVSYSDNLTVGTAKVTITGTGNYTGKIEKTFSITPAELTGVKVTGYEGTYDGKSHTITVEGLPEDAEITYSTEKDGEYTTESPSRTNVGTTEVYYKVSKANYTDLTGKVSIVITPAELSGLKVIGYEGTYDGKSHTITVEGLPEDAEITYSTEKDGEYTTDVLSRTNVGTTEVYYRVSKANYTDLTGKVDILVNAADISKKEVTGLKDSYVYTGKAITPEVTIEGLTKGQDYEVSYSSNLNVGTATVTITGKGNYTGKIEKTFGITPAELIGVKVTGYEGTYDGKSHTITVEGLPEDAEITYSTEKDGEYTTEAPSRTNVGTTEVYYKVSRPNYDTYTGKVDIVVNAADISKKEVTGLKESYVYTGKAITPEVTIEGLTKGQDYEVSYSSNVNVGTATVTITGKGNYTGKIEKTFSITPAELTGVKVAGYEGTYDGKSHTITVEGLPEDAEITYSTEKDGEYTTDVPNRTNAGTTEVYYKVSRPNYDTYTGKVDIVVNAADISKKEVTGLKESYVYTGKAITPEVTIEGLTKGQDYEVSYSSNVNVGTAKVTISGTGNYTGKIEKIFSITPAELTGVKVTGYEGTYDGKSHTITVEGLPEDAEITYSTSKDGGYAADAPSRTNAGTTEVYYKVSRPNYDTYTDKVDIVVNAADISKKEVTGLKDSYVYTGKAITPELTIEGLTEKQDYEVSYSSNLNVGTATVTTTGKGNYTGKIEKTFSITPAELTGVKVTGYEGTYDGKSHTITVEGLPDDAKITYSTEKDGEYTIDVPSRTNVGTTEVYYKVSKANYDTYSGKVDIVVNPADISKKEVTGLKDSYVYTGKAITPEVTIEGLTAKQDYEVSYSSNVNVGTATVTITGKGNYTGKIEKTFSITPAELTGVKVTGYEGTYDGKSHTVTVEGLLEDAEITYATEKDGKYTTEAPSRTEVGTTEVYYKVSKVNYKTLEGAVRIIIKPGLPSSVSSVLYGYHDIKVYWNKVSGVDGYYVYYKKSSASKYSYVRTSATSRNFAKLSDGVRYDFRVIPYVNTDEGIYKATGYKSTSVYTLKKIGKPSVKRYSSKSVKISWKSIAGGSGYQISRSTTSKGTKRVSTISTTKGKSKVISAAKNKKYYYKVRAYKTVRLNGKTRKIYAPWSVVRKY